MFESFGDNVRKVMLCVKTGALLAIAIVGGYFIWGEVVVIPMAIAESIGVVAWIK